MATPQTLPRNDTFEPFGWCLLAGQPSFGRGREHWFLKQIVTGQVLGYRARVFIGHFGVGFASKRAAPQASLGVLPPWQSRSQFSCGAWCSTLGLPRHAIGPASLHFGLWSFCSAQSTSPICLVLRHRARGGSPLLRWQCGCLSRRHGGSARTGRSGHTLPCFVGTASPT
jgi:hypothetical protein